MTTTILVFNSSHEDASATPPRAQAFFRTQKRNPFRGRATTSRRAKPHASAFHARRTRRDVQIHKPRARFLSSASRPRLFLRALTREPHFRVQKRASWIPPDISGDATSASTVLRARQNRTTYLGDRVFKIGRLGAGLFHNLHARHFF